MPRAGYYLNGRRYWANFSKYADVGGKASEPLIPEGHTLATDDPELAAVLYAKRLKDLQAFRLGLNTAGKGAIVPLDDFASRHLKALRAEGKIEEEGILRAERALRLMFSTEALAHVQVVGQLTPAVCTDLNTELSGMRSKHGRPYKKGSVRRIMMSLSRLCTRAVKEGLLPSNPVFDTAPAVEDEEAVFLEMSECRRLLEARRPHHLSPWFCERLFMLAYTGLRHDEMDGLLVEDIDFRRNRIIVRKHPHRRLKNKGSAREVPIWPPLRAMLEESLRRYPRKGLLWPRPGVEELPGKERKKAMCGDMDKALETCRKRARINKHLTPKVLRHTYVSSRLQMVERDQLGNLAPVDRFLLRREIGHADDKMINNIYGHVQAGRYRLEVLDYGLVPRWEPGEEHDEEPGDTNAPAEAEASEDPAAD